MANSTQQRRDPNRPVLPFMRWRHLAAAVSLLLVVGSLVGLAFKGLAFGLDFTGGTQIEVVYQQAEPLDSIRHTLVQAGYDKAVVVYFGSERDVLVRLPQGFSDQAGAALVDILREASGHPVSLQRIEFVGPQVGEELREQGGLALLMALGGIMIYVSLRFQFKFSVSAVAALIHDVIITLGVFAWGQLDFDLTVMAAVLAVIGYSINDTIVVFDRIRENFRKLRAYSPEEIIDISLTETLGRTIATSFTVILVLLALFFLGGEMIHNFATALIVGTVVGTYSSIYIAANIALMMGISREDLVLPPRQTEVIDDGRP